MSSNKIKRNSVQYKIKLSSLIPIPNIKYDSILQKKLQYIKSKKIIIKQSYLLLTWILYSNGKKKNYFIAPNKTKKYTILKSPMAHKTFSQEQLNWKESCAVINYTLKTNSNIDSLPTSLEFVHNQRKNLKYFTTGTNLLVPKKVNFRYYFYSNQFFKIF
jgi:hypothetical protein